MVSRALMILVALTLVSVASIQADGSWVVREDGAGPVKVGMTLPQLSEVLQQKFFMPKNKDDQGCFYAKWAKNSKVSFMIEDGRLVRVDIDGPGITTAEGIQVGDSEKLARSEYGIRLKVEPHQYIDGGHYLTVRSGDGRYGIRFETEKGKILRFYAGRFKAVQYVEGCL